MIALKALIKKFGIRSLVTGDAECEMMLRFRLDKEGFKELVDIYDAQQEVIITVSKDPKALNLDPLIHA
jgi:hypothetical protein